MKFRVSDLKDGDLRKLYISPSLDITYKGAG